MLWILLIVGGFAAYAVSSSTGSVGSSDNQTSTNSLVYSSNPWNLPDIDASNQGGGYNKAYDDSFAAASGATGVPFALIKAHAIRESSLNPNAYHFDNNSVGASYGLMQVEWIQGSNRFDKYDVPDSQIMDGSGLYDADINAIIGASIIRDNLNWLKGSLRDTINAYNTGGTEAKNPAPGNYVNDVLKYYSQIVGQTVN